MRYAEVAVNSPAAQRRSFSYSIPASLNVAIGQAVWVPFGSRVLEGVVVDLTDYPAVEETRDVAGVVDEKPVLSPAQVALARWISNYYLSPLFDAVALMLPPGFERKSLVFLSPTPTPPDFDLSSLTVDQNDALGFVRRGGRVGMKQMRKALGQKRAETVVAHLVRHGLITRTYEVEPAKVKTKTEISIRLAHPVDQTEQPALKGRKQTALLDFLAAQSGPVLWREAREKIDCDKGTLTALIKKGLVTVNEVAQTRDPLAAHDVAPSYPLPLTPAQESALQAIKLGLTRESSAQSPIFLLHGVTGSGKTEVYLQALAEAVKTGKKGIVLVPEISLTPQTIDRFASRFPRRVAVLHSQLSLGEQYDEWQRIRAGEFDVVIGARSALFAPQPNLGLIVIDEEHEWTYKQQDKSPRYHAREVAVKLARLTGSVVVVGSATPDVETYYRAQLGEYHLLRLPQRVTPVPNAPLPPVEIADLREELKSGNAGLFSRSLSQAVLGAVSGGKQVILFLNRRGTATFIQCRNCGFVMRCRRCDIALTYHSATDTLVCHQCNYHMPAPSVCPNCGSQRMKFLGAGTQKLEQETGTAFPGARVLRWDSDTTATTDSHQDISRAFRDHKADILIGTQMVTKGLDVPGVTVVGVVNADTALNLPDFRAGERTFQLLAQVAGRAGRGPGGGRVIFQTYNPTHYAIQAAARHDYAIFYDKEITYRRQLNYPPFSRLASLVYSHANETRCQKEAQRLAGELQVEIQSRGIAGISLIGPAPAFVHRLRGRFRWQIILRGGDLSGFLADVPMPKGWTVDIDPVGLA